jgi:hypothetical protein
MAKIRTFTNATVLAKMDGRTKEARLVRETRANLIAHLGGNPSATQRQLVERVVQLTLRVAAMDRKFAETGAHTLHDTNQYLAWSNSLERALRHLGLNPVAPKPKDLAAYIESRAA